MAKKRAPLVDTRSARLKRWMDSPQGQMVKPAGSSQLSAAWALRVST
jgi:hypothetical protein